MNPSFLSKEDYELTVDDIKPYLVNAKTKGEQIISACPICESEDSKGHHLYVKNTRDKLLCYCQKCNSDGRDIIKAFRNMGAKHTPSESVPRVVSSVVENYDHVYKNPDGTVAYCKQRVKYSDGSKRFSFHYSNNSGNEIWSKPKDCNVLYNLDLMQIASECEETPILYIVEGEKCADALTDMGLLATTSNTGAKNRIKFSEIDKEMLSRFPIKIVIPDNDDAGQEYIEAWKGADVLNLCDIWENCPKKADIADYIEAGLPLEPIVNFKTYDLSQEAINRMSATELTDVNFLRNIFREKDLLTRQGILSLAEIRAGELHCKSTFKALLKAYLKDLNAKRGVNSCNVQSFDENAPINGLNCGEWVADMGGIRRFISTEEGAEEEFASYIPITPSAILKNIENGTEKAALSFYTDNVWHTINIPRSVIANNNKIIDLADLGVDVNSGSAKSLVRYLADVINTNDSSNLPRYSTVSHLGWVDDKFIPYCKGIVTDVGVEFQDTVNSVSESGELEEWAEFVRPLRENIYLRVALATSFSSPLICKVNALPYVLHLWGGSGTGKTVALQVAASVWGDPNMGKLVKSLNNTINYTMSMLGLLKHLPFFGDELQTIREKLGGYDEMLYRVTEGVDRGRMTNSIVQRINSWQNCMIFTGEEPCTLSRSGGGVKNRVIEVECRDKVITDGHTVSGFVKHHYGCAGRVFIDALQDYCLNDEYRNIYGSLNEQVDSTEKQTMAMALIMLGDKISSECIFRDDPLSAKDIVGFLKSSSEVDVSVRAYNALCDFISEHIQNFNDNISSLKWGKTFSDGQVYILKTVLERELANMGYDFNAVKSKWAERGYLVKNSQGRYTGRYYVNGQHANYVVIKC